MRLLFSSFAVLAVFGGSVELLSKIARFRIRIPLKNSFCGQQSLDLVIYSPALFSILSNSGSNGSMPLSRHHRIQFDQRISTWRGSVLYFQYTVTIFVACARANCLRSLVTVVLACPYRRTEIAGNSFYSHLMQITRTYFRISQHRVLQKLKRDREHALAFMRKSMNATSRNEEVHVVSSYGNSHWKKRARKGCTLRSVIRKIRVKQGIKRRLGTSVARKQFCDTRRWSSRRDLHRRDKLDKLRFPFAAPGKT